MAVLVVVEVMRLLLFVLGGDARILVVDDVRKELVVNEDALLLAMGVEGKEVAVAAAGEEAECVGVLGAAVMSPPPLLLLLRCNRMAAAMRNRRSRECGELPTTFHDGDVGLVAVPGGGADEGGDKGVVVAWVRFEGGDATIPRL